MGQKPNDVGLSRKHILTMEQLEDNLGVSGWKLSDEQVKRLTDVSAPEDIYPYRFIREAQRI